MKPLQNPERFTKYLQDCADLFAADPMLRNDAQGNAAFLARELEYVFARTFDVLYSPIKGRLLVPINHEVPPGAESFSYDQFDQIGLAQWVTNYASEPPRVDVFKKRFTAATYDFWSSYAYTVRDVKRAAMAAQVGPPASAHLDVKRAQTARLIMERFLDTVIATGDTTRGLLGLTNNTNIPTVSTTSGAWSGDAASDIYADLTALCQAPEQATHTLFKADTLVLPLNQKATLSQPYSSFIPDSLISVWLRSQQDITTVEYWDKLNTASAIGGPRALAYAKNDTVLEFVVPQEYEEFPPQIENLETKIICLMTVGGLTLHYPLACAKMDLDA